MIADGKNATQHDHWEASSRRAGAATGSGTRTRLVPTLLLAVIVGAVLRWQGISGIELQYDEAATGYFAGLPWADLWGGPAVLEPNPPLFYSIARLVVLGGGGVEHIRYISAAAGTLCIPAAWLVGRLLAGEFAAGAAAWLVATSPQNIAFSQYARTYALLSLLLLCAFLCLVIVRRAAAGRSGVWWWSCYAAASTASLYLHHTAIVILAVVNLSALVSSLGSGRRGRRSRAGLLAANAVVVSAYLPWMPVLIHQALPTGGLMPVATAQSTSLLQRLVTAARRPFVFHGLPWVSAWLLPLDAFGAWQLRASRDVIALVPKRRGRPAPDVLHEPVAPDAGRQDAGVGGLVCTDRCSIGPASRWEGSMAVAGLDPVCATLDRCVSGGGHRRGPGRVARRCVVSQATSRGTGCRLHQ